MIINPPLNYQIYNKELVCMKIYLTNLGKYNEGYLVGEWVHLPISSEDLKEVFDRIGKVTINF